MMIGALEKAGKGLGGCPQALCDCLLSGAFGQFFGSLAHQFHSPAHQGHAIGGPRLKIGDNLPEQDGGVGRDIAFFRFDPLPAVVIGHQRNQGVADLGLPGQTGFGHRGHADQIAAPEAVHETFSAR